MCCLAKQPEQRFQRMADLVTALQAAGRAGAIEFEAPPAFARNRPASPIDGPVAAPPLPSTLVAGRGQVAARQRLPRRRGLVFGLLGGGVVAAAAVAIAVVASSNRPSEPVEIPPARDIAAATSPDASIAVIDAARAVATAVDPPGDRRAWLDRATRAMADRRWREALDLTQAGLDRDPSDAVAKQLVAHARSELASEATYKQLEQHVADGQLAAAIAAYDKIGNDSVYRASAQQAIDKARQQFIAATRSRAQRLAAQHKCTDLQHLASEAGAVLPEAKAAAEIPCAEATSSRSDDSPRRPEQRDARRPASAINPAEPSVNDASPFMPLPKSDAVLEEARGAAKAGQWAVALQKAEEAVRLGAGVDALAIAALGACNLKNLAKARSYISKLPPSQQATALQSCLRNGIDPQ